MVSEITDDDAPSLLSLPPEVLRGVAVYLRPCPADILSLALVGNEVLLECAREQLYRTVLVVPSSEKLMRTLKDSEYLADLVKDVTVAFRPSASDPTALLNNFASLIPTLTNLSCLRIDGMSRWLKVANHQQKSCNSECLTEFWNTVSDADTVHTLQFNASLPKFSFRPPPYFNTLALCGELDTSNTNPELIFPPGLRRLFCEVTDAILPPQIFFTLEDLVIYSGGEKTEKRIQNVIESIRKYYSQHSGLNRFPAHNALRRLTLDCEELSLTTLHNLLHALRAHPIEHLHLLCVPEEGIENKESSLFHDISNYFGQTLMSLVIYLGRGYEIVPWESLARELAHALKGVIYLHHIEINHSDGFTGPGGRDDAMYFAQLIPSLDFISFGGKFHQCLSISWVVDHGLNYYGHYDDDPDSNVYPKLIEVPESRRPNPRPSAREWTNDKGLRNPLSSAPGSPATPAAAW